MVNRYSGSCVACRGPVAANAGTLVRRYGKLRPAHLNCAGASAAAPRSSYRPRVETFTFFGDRGAVHETRNARGRCEDAPACGCCTF